MNVLVYGIPVEILSFNEESSVILTKQVPLPLRKFVTEFTKLALMKKEFKELEELLIQTTVEIKDKEFLAGIYLRRNPSTIYTLPDSNKHWINQELEQEDKLKRMEPVNQLYIKLIKEI